MPPSSWLLALLSLSAADALRGGSGAMTGGSRAALKSGAQSQHTQPVTPRSVVVLHAAAAAVLALASPAPRTSRVGLCGAAKRPQQVSNLGRVRSANGIITEGWESGGYRRVQISGKNHLVHRLVASQADFVQPPLSEKHTQINHKDRDPANNCADNLEWVTRSENNQHSHNPERKSSALKNSKPVLGRRHGSEEEWVEYESGNAAARALELTLGSVSRCCRGKAKRTGEYEFKWAPPAEDQSTTRPERCGGTWSWRAAHRGFLGDSFLRRRGIKVRAVYS